MDDSYISWSTIGVDCREIPQDQPSLNFTYLTGGTDEKTIKAEVLKGFGHVLGLLFEHQNPTSPVEIKPGADLVEEYNISQELADEIRNQYSSLECNYNEYDKYSIMVLGIPKKLLVNPRYYAPENYDLSPSDTALIAQQYPYPPACVTMETMKNTVSIVIDDIASLFHFWIDWGDGIKENTTYIRTNHTYKDGIAKHKITIGGGKIIELSCDDNKLTSLDIKNAGSKIWILTCRHNELKTLDVSQNSNLRILACEYNQLNTLDLSNNKNLTSVGCNNNNLGNIHVSGLSKLWELECNDNHLQSLDLSTLSNLTNLNCSKNSISTIDVSHNPALKNLIYNNGNLVTLMIDDNNILEKFECESSNIQNTDWLSKMPNLKTLFCSNNNLNGKLDISQNTALRSLRCYNCSLTSLNTQQNPLLNELNLGFNPNINFDLTSNDSLEYFNCSYCNLITLDISHNRQLNTLSCNNNNLSKLEISGLTNLQNIYLYSNPLVQDNTVLQNIADNLPYRSMDNFNYGRIYIERSDLDQEFLNTCQSKCWLVDKLSPEDTRLKSSNFISNAIAQKDYRMDFAY